MGDTLENPIENVAMIVLRAVVEKDLETKTKGNYNGPDLKELTGLSHEWINDAISFLETTDRSIKFRSDFNSSAKLLMYGVFLTEKTYNID